jgi:ubiquinone/menaquinone biosynthesis C-methylase UbiE
LKDHILSEAIYPLGRSREETQRLQQQSQFYNPFTRRLLEDAGIKIGMKVLDAGCGAGDVTLIASEMVGRNGWVVGVDTDPELIETARIRSRDQPFANVSFVNGDLDTVVLEDDFDAVVGRLILMYMPDPERTIKKLLGYTRAGGIVAFQEADWTNKPASLPVSQRSEQIYSWMLRCFQKAGVETQMGLKLYRTFINAGLSEPQMHLEAPLGGGPNWAGYAYVANSIRSMLPLMVKLNIVSSDEVDIDGLADTLRKEVVDQNGVVMLSPFISAWAIKR